MTYKKFSKLSLWVTCPHCKKVYGVSPEIVKKYMDRVSGKMEQKNEMTEYQNGKENQKKES